MTPPERASGEDGPTPFERGLAAERTFLAWNRTALAFLALGGLLLKEFPPLPSSGFKPVPGFAMLVVGGIILVNAYATFRRRPAADAPVARAGVLRFVATATTIVAVVSVALAFVPVD